MLVFAAAARLLPGAAVLVVLVVLVVVVDDDDPAPEPAPALESAAGFEPYDTLGPKVDGVAF